MQENGINVVHIESRRSRRNDSEYEIYVDLEADRQRIEQSMRELRRQVSCVRFDLNNIGEITDSINELEDQFDIPPASPFLDKNGQPISRKSKLTFHEKIESGIRCFSIKSIRHNQFRYEKNKEPELVLT